MTSKVFNFEKEIKKILQSHENHTKNITQKAWLRKRECVNEIKKE